MFDNIVTKGENKFYLQFLLLSQGFLKKKPCLKIEKVNGVME